MGEGLSQRELARRFEIDRKTLSTMLAYSVPPGYRQQDQYQHMRGMTASKP
jgi:hypothetical protein